MQSEKIAKNATFDQALRKQLVALLEGGQAHLTFTDAIKGFPVEKAGIRPTGCPHSAWELLEHIRIAQEDIVQFSGAAEEELPPTKYRALKWPDEYWPKAQAPENPGDWQSSVNAILRDLATFVRTISDPARDLSEPFSWGDGQNLLREALLLADHNSYHLGQLVLVRKMLE